MRGVERAAARSYGVIVDARSAGRFAGVEPEPRDGLIAGHIPGSVNLPYTDVVDDSGLLKTPEELQTLVDQWNQRTEETLSAYQGVYFVPINDLLYKGIDGKSGVTESELGKETVTNDALYDEDSFHPNNTGYEIIKEAVLEKIHATEKKWFE